MHFWLDQPIHITKKMIHRITGLPMLNKAKTIKTLGRVELAKRTLAKWDGRSMEINRVIDMEIKFNIHVIAHEIYISNKLNNVPCEAVDLVHKVVKNNLFFELAELQLNQLSKKLEDIWSSKKNPCKFGSILTCLFFYIQKFFPSKGTVARKKDAPILYQFNEFIVEMGDNFESIMEAYFETFKEKMKSMYRIPNKLVEYYEQDIFFLVDYDKVHI